jgi:hypothetical protein
VIEPARDGTWVLKARKVKSRPSGVPEQQAFYASADGDGWLWIRTVSAADAGPGIEEDQARAHREVSAFYLFSPGADGPRNLPSRHRSDPPDIASGWSAATITVDGTPVAVRTARVGDHGWIGWWAHTEKIVEIQSDTASVSTVNLVSAP